MKSRSRQLGAVPSTFGRRYRMEQKTKDAGLSRAISAVKKSQAILVERQ